MKRYFVVVAVQTLVWINRPLDRLILALLNMVAGEAKSTSSSFPARVLSDPKRFVIDIGRDGFNAYVQRDGRMELVAASSAMSTLTRMMQDAVKAGTGADVRFGVAWK